LSVLTSFLSSRFFNFPGASAVGMEAWKMMELPAALSRLERERQRQRERESSCYKLFGVVSVDTCLLGNRTVQSLIAADHRNEHNVFYSESFFPN
jgi:hypothetical protein